jgi:hypothetical protein
MNVNAPRKQSKAIRKGIVQVEREKMISLLTGKLLELHFEWHTERTPDVAGLARVCFLLPLRPTSQRKMEKVLGISGEKSRKVSISKSCRNC